jgi:DNA-directed RNA polymerase subunit RPC12/RpoP
MSEFKYTCPVCGQHIKCDSSQSGSEMECPTCLQKIIAPQAPASAHQKFIITGKKAEERPRGPVSAVSTPAVPATPMRNFPFAAVALVVLLVLTAAAAIVFRAKLFKSGTPPATMAPPPPVHTNPPTPAVVVAPSVDSPWRNNLAGVSFPDTPVAGRIHGQEFLADRAFLQNGTLILRRGTEGPMDFGLTINFSGVRSELLAGQSINITTNAPLAARVTLRWNETNQSLRDNFETGYALRLDFGTVVSNHLSGKIYFCAPDDAKSYIAGVFNAEIRRPRQESWPKP